MSVEDNIRKSSELQRDSNRVAFGFLLSDADTGLTFAQLALEASDDAQKRARNHLNARTAYQAVMHFRDRIDVREVSQADIQELEFRLRRLRTALDKLGSLE